MGGVRTLGYRRMKILLDYKIGPYARYRKLKILIREDILSGEICLTEIKQGEQKEVEIPENVQFIYGSMDWGKTKKINIQNMSEGECLEIVPYFTLNLLATLGLTTLPISIDIKKNVKPCYNNSVTVK